MHPFFISICALRFVATIAKPVGLSNEDFQGLFDPTSLESSSYDSALSDSSDQNSIFIDTSEDNPLDQDDSGYLTEFLPSDESAFLPELADNSNLISSCQAQQSSSDILNARGLFEDTSDLFQEASNDNGSPAACPNADTTGSASGPNNPKTGSNNNNHQNNQGPPNLELKAPGLLDINSQQDEELCPTGSDGVKQVPLCCWSPKNVMGSSRKYACFSLQENNNPNCQYWYYQYCCKIYEEDNLEGDECTQGFEDGSFRIPVILPIVPIVPPASQD